MESRIIVGVPGPWEDQSAFVRATATAGRKPRFVAAGAILLDTETGASLLFEIQPRSPAVTEAFALAGGGRLSEIELARIGHHRTTVYLINSNCTPAGARQVMAAAAHLLDAGGLGVKIESAGVAHGPERWRYFASAPSSVAMYRAFVTLIGGDRGTFHYSCGMHNFGLPDASVTGKVPADEAAGILTTFNHWNLIERPSASDGEWFACGRGEPAFKASKHDYGYEPESSLNNPFGRWHLEPTRAKPPGEYGNDDGQPLFMALSRNDPEIQAARERARASAGYFLDHFASPHEYGTYMVKVHLSDGEDSAYIWALLEGAEGEALTARLFEMPPEFRSYKGGQTITVARGDIHDWSIIQSGTLVGGFSLRVQRGHVPAAKRRAYDLYSGTLSYAPTEEIP